jgi:hypothetical protein
MKSVSDQLASAQKIQIEFIADAPRDLRVKIQKHRREFPILAATFSAEAHLKISCARPAERTRALPADTRLVRAEEQHQCNSSTTNNNMSKHSRARSAQNPNKSSKPGATREFKVAEFNFEAPEALSVKLAADFTDWEKRPLDMNKADDGKWHLHVPLSPGDYSYRFIVDGEWRDDPRPVKQVYNPFGTTNAVVNIS